MIELETGERAPEQVNAVIEIPRDSNVKYEVDKKTGLLRVNRFLFTATTYPYNYGFIPQTLEDDGDPLDVLVVCEEALVPGCIVEVKPVGMLVTEDESGIDNKVIAIPAEQIDPTYGEMENVQEFNDHILKRIAHFFGTYKELEPEKWVKVKGFKGKKQAIERIEHGMKKYRAAEK